MALYVKDGGTWRETQSLFVKQAGSWVPVTKVWIKDNGNWKQIAPDAGSYTQTSAGTGTFVIPAMVYSINVISLVAGGASGNACWFCGNGYPGGGGGSGAYIANQAMVVTPGETITVVIGAGGAYKPFEVCQGNPIGNAGGVSSVTAASGAAISVNGGSGGTPGQPGGGGTGGSPNGINGSSGVMPYYGGAGGNNGTGYGTGGQGGNILLPDNQKGGNPGTSGYVSIAW